LDEDHGSIRNGDKHGVIDGFVSNPTQNNCGQALERELSAMDEEEALHGFNCDYDDITMGDEDGGCGGDSGHDFGQEVNFYPLYIPEFRPEFWEKAVSPKSPPAMIVLNPQKGGGILGRNSTQDTARSLGN
jgi:hypothetical protein